MALNRKEVFQEKNVLYVYTKHKFDYFAFVIYTTTIKPVKIIGFEFSFEITPIFYFSIQNFFHVFYCNV